MCRVSFGRFPCAVIDDELLERGILCRDVEMRHSCGNIHHIPGTNQNRLLAPLLIKSRPCDADDGHRPVHVPAAVTTGFKGNHIRLRKVVCLIGGNEVISVYRPMKAIRYICAEGKRHCPCGADSEAERHSRRRDKALALFH